MSNSVTDFINRFNEIIKSCEAYQFITRDSDLQKEALVSLSDLRRQVLAVKDKAIKNQDEQFSNILLGYECVIQSLMSELQMWLDLKLGEPDKAWDNLILAQNSNIAAMRSDEGFGHLVPRSKKLELIENLIFPPQTFLSTGLIAGSQECSICNKEYENCDHIKGKPYMGDLCRLIIKDIIELNHVAIVENPADKGCRIIKDGARNRMTFKIEDVLQESPK
jgi:hypothetical protein